jgi:3-dehydroquinate dehydratase/shikimate dehydrogenase
MRESKSALVCVPVCERRARDFTQAIARAAEVADIIELRLDCLEVTQLDGFVRELGALLYARPRPFILTLRPAEQGGSRAIGLRERILFRLNNHFYFDGQRQHADYEDVEIDLALLYAQRESEGWTGYCDWSRAICSYHDFVGVPSDLEEIYQRMAMTPAHVLKIAVLADDVTDCLPVFALLERARREGRKMIAIAMGTAGIMTRVLAPSRGAFLTYAALDEAYQTARGQITATELRDLYRVHRINERTQITGLVGSPIAHSLSPQMHNRAFDARGVDAVYIPFEVRDVKEFMRRMVHPRTREFDWNLRGLSVTAPHKEGVNEFLDWIEPAAQEIGAVNTIVIENNALYGYNTDASAFLAPLEKAVGSLKSVRAALVGTGGAARAALWALRRVRAHITVFARDGERAQYLAREFGVNFAPLENARFSGFDIVINATPLGSRGPNENETPARFEQLRGAQLAYDLVYNPPLTRFLNEARSAGCGILNGLPMLVAQAAAQYELWTSEAAPLDEMQWTALACLEKQL